jgi:hypothetical protein
MAIRRREIRPDTVLETVTYGNVPYVSEQAFLDAVLAVAQSQMLVGGSFGVVACSAHPTDLEHEMVTVRAVIEWRDRTDAKPQPEPAVDTQPAVLQAGLFEQTAPDLEEPAELATEAVPVTCPSRTPRRPPRSSRTCQRDPGAPMR